MRFLILFLTVFTFKIVLSQEPIHYFIGKEEFDGVNIYSAIQDDFDKSVWITSNKGLHNYNGENFTFQIPKEASSNSFFNLAKDNKGNIYFLNLNGQIFKIVNKTPKLFYTIPSKYLRDGIQMEIDTSGLLLIRIQNQLLTLNTQGKLINYQKNTGFFLNKVNDTIFYIKGTTHKTKYQYNSLKLMCYNNSIEKTILNYSIQDYKKPKILPQDYFFKVKNAFYSYSAKEQCFYQLLENAEKRINYKFITHPKFRPYHSGKSIWFCDYKNGVFKLDENKIHKTKTLPKWFKNYFISGVITDNEQNTWLLTFGKGIILLPNTPIKTKLISHPKKNFNSISKSEQHIYVGTNNNSIFKLENDQLIHFKTFQETAVEWFKIFPEKNLILTNEKLLSNNRKKRLGFTKKAIIHNDTVFAATIWGFEVQHSKDFSINYHKSNKRSHDIAFDKKNNSFLLSTISGSYWYTKDTEHPFLNNGKHLYTKRLINVNNQIWATTNEGIYIIENKKVVDSLTIRNGLLTNQINSIKYEKPYVYLSSSEGIQRLNLDTNKFKNILNSDGLINKIKSFEVKNDTIYALNSNGIISFTFKNFDNSIKKHQTTITEVLVNGIEKLNNNSILSPYQNNLEFSFLTTSYKYRDITYEYQLLGFEKKPIKAKYKHVNYSNLPPGNYTFKVDSYIKGKRNFPATFIFTIQKHWYQTLVFKLLAISICLLMTFLIYRSRINYLKQNRYKYSLEKRLAESSLTSLKAQMNPHFIFNAINSIQSLVLHKKQKEAYSYLTQLADLIRNNLDMSDISFVTLHQELSLISQYLKLEKLRFEDSFEYKIDNQISDTEIKIPSMIIQPFIENAVKHGLLHKEKDRKLSIQFHQEQDIVTCTIIDNGIGRAASEEINSNKNYNSFSTKAIEKRFNILKEYYKLDLGYVYEDLKDREKATGTKVIIKIVIDQNEY